LTRRPLAGIQGRVTDPFRPPADDALPTLEGRAWAFGFALDAHQVLAPEHAALPAVEARRHLFTAIDPALATRLAPGDVVVADEMTGGADTFGPALAALAAAGIGVLLARRFTPGLAVAGPAHGVAVLELDAPSFVHSGDRVRIDLDAGKVVNLSSGDRAPIRNLGDGERETLRRMLDAHGA
jgi:hypothetical protein